MMVMVVVQLAATNPVKECPLKQFGVFVTNLDVVLLMLIQTETVDTEICRYTRRLSATQTGPDWTRQFDTQQVSFSSRCHKQILELH